MITFDVDEQAPYDEATTCAQAAAIVSNLHSDAQVLDLGCGIGRVAVHFPSEMRIDGVDRCSDSLTEYAKSTKATTHQLDLVEDCQLLPRGPFDAVIMLGNTLMEVIDPVAGLRLFKEIAQRLRADGVFVIDDFPVSGWREVAAGNWRDGIDDSGSMQMVWGHGEPIFTLRRGSAVNPENWSIGGEERKFRLWSMGELRLMGSLVGLGAPLHQEEGAVVVMKRKETELGETNLPG